MALTQQQFDQYGIKLLQRPDNTFLYGTSQGLGNVDTGFAQQLVSSGVTANPFDPNKASDQSKYSGINWNTSGLANLTSEQDIMGRYGAQYANQQAQAQDVQQAGQLNSAISAGNAALVEQLKPGYTLWNGAFVQKSQIPQLQSSGATVQGGNVVGPKVPGLGGQAPSGFKSKFQSGFETANAAGAEGGAEVVNQYASSKNINSSIDNFFNNNPFVQQTSDQLMETLSPQSTRDSIQKYIDQLATDRSELAGLKTELMNNKRIMSGSEQDIRDEIQKSGGFGTNSQILALTISRNRSLIERNSQISDLMQTQQDAVNTDVSILQAENQLAQNEFSNRMSILNYQQENTKYMFSAANDMYKSLMDKDPRGLYNSLSTDPTQAQRFTSITGIDVNTLKSLADKQEKEALSAAQKDKTFGSVDLGNRVAILDNTGKVTRYENKGAVPKDGDTGPGKISSTTQAIIDNPSLFDDLTPTVRGKVVSELQANGYETSNLGTKTLSDTAITQISQTQKALDDLANLKSIVSSNTDKLGPIKGLAALNPWSSSRKLQADVDRIRQTVGKALEGGVLRKEDEEKYKKILATLTDTPSTAIYKIDALISSIQRDIETYKSLQQSGGRSLNVNAPLTKQGATIQTKPEDLRNKYNY